MDGNKEKFYEKFGFVTRSKANLGEGMILNNKQEGRIFLEKLNLNENIRPEELSIEDFAKISENL